jgi:hypothetical protein
MPRLMYAPGSVRYLVWYRPRARRSGRSGTFLCLVRLLGEGAPCEDWGGLYIVQCFALLEPNRRTTHDSRSRRSKSGSSFARLATAVKSEGIHPLKDSILRRVALSDGLRIESPH